MINSILWHDYETFGISPAFDRPAQFAAIRTDEDLNIIGEPIELFCQPQEDYLPHPEAVLVTGIQPQMLKQKGSLEADFFAAIYQHTMQAGTCTAGYNSIRFDDEFTRYGLYRNFFDPYEREYKNNNSRWDLLDVMRAAYALRPDGINWPTTDDGKVSFKLENLSVANNIEHANAHDALADVRATIALAQRLKQAQPKLYAYFYQRRYKQALLPLINIAEKKPLLHVSGRIGVERGCMAVMVPLCMHPKNKNSVIMFDLSQSPQCLFDLTAQELQARLFTPEQTLLEQGLERVHLKQVHLNKSPILAPANTLDAQSAKRWQLDGTRLREHRALLQKGQDLTAKLHSVFHQPELDKQRFEQNKDVDAGLYNGFFKPQDKLSINAIRSMNAEQLATHTLHFNDPRLEEMLFRYKARNYPQSLTEQEHQRWQTHKVAKLCQSDNPQILTFQRFAQALQDASVQYENAADKLALLQELQWYAESIYPLE